MTDYYTCGHCGGYAPTCGCVDKIVAASVARRERRGASTEVVWCATIAGWRRRAVEGASHVAEARRLAGERFGHLGEITAIRKIVTTTEWADDWPD